MLQIFGPSSKSSNVCFDVTTNYCDENTFNFDLINVIILFCIYLFVHCTYNIFKTSNSLNTFK